MEVINLNILFNTLLNGKNLKTTDNFISYKINAKLIQNEKATA